jgi:hypothetical protein
MMQIIDGRSRFYQWDMNQQLTCDGLAVGDEVHFANAASTEALVVEAYALEDGTVVANVPNALLREPYPITAYRYIMAGAAEYTREAITFEVQKRPRPSDYIYTETEVYSFEVLSAEMRQALATLDEFNAKQDETLKALAEADEAIREEIGKKADATATEGALAGKLDRIKTTLSSDAVYTEQPNGSVRLRNLAWRPSASNVAQFSPKGTIKSKTATESDDAVPLAQMTESLADKAGAKEVETIAKKVENLEAGISPDMFVVDDATAYIKTIPTDAAPYAELLAVGGMTYLSEGMDADLGVLVGDGNNFDIQIDAEYGTICVGVAPTSTMYYTTAPFSSIFKDAEIGKTYMLTYTVSGSTGGFLSIGQWPNRPNLNVPFTLTSDIYNSGIEFANSYIDTEAGMYADTAYFSNLKLTEIGGATRYAKVTEIVSKGIYGNVIGTLHIPAEVQSLDGYGESGYRIVWDEDGKPWWHTPYGHTDISQYFTEDNLIRVEGGGTITAVNEHGLAAPTTIVYQKRGV